MRRHIWKVVRQISTDLVRTKRRAQIKLECHDDQVSLALALMAKRLDAAYKAIGASHVTQPASGH